MRIRKQKKRKNLGDIFDKHVNHEFIDHDVEATMKTMVKEPIVHNVPILTGGIGFDNVYNFYKNEFVGKMPDDTKKRFLIRNSWGVTWGTLGYGTMPYKYLSDRNLSDDFWTVRTGINM